MKQKFDDPHADAEPNGEVNQRLDKRTRAFMNKLQTTFADNRIGLMETKCPATGRKIMVIMCLMAETNEHMIASPLAIIHDDEYLAKLVADDPNVKLIDLDQARAVVEKDRKKPVSQ